jgi:hypothetical protein
MYHRDHHSKILAAVFVGISEQTAAKIYTANCIQKASSKCDIRLEEGSQISVNNKTTRTLDDNYTVNCYIVTIAGVLDWTLDLLTT